MLGEADPCPGNSLLCRNQCLFGTSLPQQPAGFNGG